MSPKDYVISQMWSHTNDRSNTEHHTAHGNIPGQTHEEEAIPVDNVGECTHRRERRADVVAGAGYAGLHVALRLTTKLRGPP